MVRARINRQAGGVLLAVVGVVLVVALAVFAKTILQDVQRGLSKQRVIAMTLGASDSKIDKALANFVAQNKRLPCPADGTVASGALNAGVEKPFPPTGSCNPVNQANGVVPWVTLGISEGDAADPWNGRITYRVQPELASNPAKLMDMSWCDPAGTPTGASGPALACTPGCAGATCMNPVNFLYAKGLRVQDGAGGWLNQPAPAWAGAPTPPPSNANGAAYVLISHGPTGAGAYNSAGIVQTGSTFVGSNEMPNFAVMPLTGATIFIDAAQNASANLTHFDDYLSHPTIATVLGHAGLGARTAH